MDQYNHPTKRRRNPAMRTARGFLITPDSRVQLPKAQHQKLPTSGVVGYLLAKYQMQPNIEQLASFALPPGETACKAQRVDFF